jgi:hypothetical protein
LVDGGGWLVDRVGQAVVVIRERERGESVAKKWWQLFISNAHNVV